MKRVLCLIWLCLCWATVVSAQTVSDACNTIPAGTTFVVTSGAPFTVQWTMSATVLGDDGQTQVPHRINGFYLQIDASPRIAFNVAPGPPCPVGTAQAGRLPYTYRTTSGVARGNHTLTLRGWNYVMDCSTGVCIETTVVQEGIVATIPFVAADPMHMGPPGLPGNVSIRR